MPAQHQSRPRQEAINNGQRTNVFHVLLFLRLLDSHTGSLLMIPALFFSDVFSPDAGFSFIVL